VTGDQPDFFEDAFSHRFAKTSVRPAKSDRKRRIFSAGGELPSTLTGSSCAEGKSRGARCER
jgi:hypothetical protein